MGPEGEAPRTSRGTGEGAGRAAPGAGRGQAAGARRAPRCGGDRDTACDRDRLRMSPVRGARGPARREVLLVRHPLRTADWTRPRIPAAEGGPGTARAHERPRP